MESYTELTEKPINLSVKLAPLPDVALEMPDITPVEGIGPITDVQPDDYNLAMNNLVAKYKKIK